MGATLHVVKPDISYEREAFPSKTNVRFLELFFLHGKEVADQPFDLDWARYKNLEDQGRLVWIVARNSEGVAVGYSGHYWYFDLHWRNHKIAVDDLWYVLPALRRDGVGKRLKMLGLQVLREQGVTSSCDLIRVKGGKPANDCLRDMGYYYFRTQWKIDL